MSVMKQDSGHTFTDAAALRKRAEEKVGVMEPLSLSEQNLEEMQQVLHELRVHQIELEMQNEELRTAHAEIEAGRARYFDLYDLAPVGYCTVSKSGLIQEANITAATLLGVNRTALVKQPLSRFILKEDQDIYYLSSKRLFNTGEAQECELHLVKSDDSVFWAHLTKTASQTEDGEPVIRVVLSDISERKQTEEEIRNMNEKLHKVNAEKDKLFTIIAHDLESPLSGVFSASELLAKEGESLPFEEISQLMAAIHLSSRNVLKLLNDLMQWASMSQEGMGFSPEECNLHELVRSNLCTAQDVAGKKNIILKSDIPADLTVMVDQAMINTVIRNVIFNAIKFTHQGGTISLCTSMAGPFVEVLIQDNGIGISETLLSSIFSLEKCKKRLGTDGEKGTGLGLVLCKEFVEKHCGKIWVESVPDKGTKVYFTLPVVSRD